MIETPSLANFSTERLGFVTIKWKMCIRDRYNAIKQMPKGAKTYLSGFHSYWYLKK